MKMFVTGHSDDYEVDEEKDEYVLESVTFTLLSEDKKTNIEVTFNPGAPEIDKLYAAFNAIKPVEINVYWRDTGESILSA